MRIGIDVRYLSHGLVGGVHTYVAHFVQELIELAVDHQVYLYADTKCPLELTSLPARVTVRYLPWRHPLSSIYNDLFMRRRMSEDHLDVVHFPTNYGFGPSGACTIVTLHDAMNILPLHQIFRGLALGSAKTTPRLVAMTAYLHYCTRAALRYTDLVLTDSEHARREIARVGSIDPKRILPIPLAAASDVRRCEDSGFLADVRQRYELTMPFVLADALKNPGALVQAWRMLPSALCASHQIVFFSRRPDLLPIVHEAVAAGQARLLVRPPREDLIALYSLAEAFVFPSWIEGFGIPVLEAMACGTPVIASNRGAIPEVTGEAALLADPEDPAAFARHLALVLGTPTMADRLRELGFARAREFSWRKTARQILESYSLALSGEAIAVGNGNPVGRS